MKDENWFWTMKKPQVPLAQGLHHLSLPLMRKNLGIEIDLPIKHVDGDIYFSKEALDKISKEIENKISQDPTYPDKIQELIEKEANNLLDTTKSLSSINVNNLSNEELIKSFLEGYYAIARVTAFMSFKGTIQISEILEKKVRLLLQNKINDAEEVNDTFLLISLPREDSFMTKERKNILKIAIENQAGKEISSLLENHTNEFSWMGCIMYLGEPYKKSHFKEELENELKEDCSTKLNEINNQRKTREESITTFVNKLTTKEKELVYQFRTWIHLRTYVKDLTSIGMEPTISFLKEIAKRLEVEYNGLLYLSNDELQHVFSDKNNLIKESKERQKGWGVILKEGKITYYHDLEGIREKEESIPSGVKGFAACKGIVKGKAIIVRSIEDLDKIEDGDILITHMTTTNFVPYLSKVSAIITDEGGITCHAAIVSREMNIPCIIGTRIGTKAFKSGDILEVDANKGVVKKL